MSKPFDLTKALNGALVKVKHTEDPRRIVGQSAFRNDEYIIEDEWGAYRLPLTKIQNGFLMYEENK
ncbi:hypothetical protein ACJ7Z2_09605 [Mannheimia glucosida]|uniref:hypothetical protein n=1 Tax=Mannheimia glucosida TaxID=85401 RepID=UPI00391807D2